MGFFLAPFAGGALMAAMVSALGAGTGVSLAVALVVSLVCSPSCARSPVPTGASCRDADGYRRARRP